MVKEDILPMYMMSSSLLLLTRTDFLPSSTAHKNSISSLQWNKNGNWLASCSRDQLIKMYDLRMLREFQVFRGHKREVNGRHRVSRGNSVCDSFDLFLLTGFAFF
jgi:WD40 repeat protein